MGPWSAAQNVMFEAAEQEVAKKTKNFGGTRLRKRDTDDQVDRSLKTHFFGWTSLEVDGHQVDGHTLRQQLLADKRAVKAGIMARLGSSYWKDMQAKFAGPDRPTKTLTIANKNEMCDTALMFALEMATHNNTTMKSRAPMIQYFASSDSVNQKEYVGILRHARGQTRHEHSCDCFLHRLHEVLHQAPAEHQVPERDQPSQGPHGPGHRQLSNQSQNLAPNILLP